MRRLRCRRRQLRCRQAHSLALMVLVLMLVHGLLRLQLLGGPLSTELGATAGFAVLRHGLRLLLLLLWLLG